MIDSKNRLPVAFLGTEFNDFLFAAMGVDRTGDPLSVVSALARMDLDPWAEAAKLSQLPDDVASQTLMGWMSRFPALVASLEERRKAATRLVALLPQNMPPAPIAGRQGNVTQARAITAFFVLGLFLMFAGEVFLNFGVASPHAQVDRPAAASTLATQPPGS